MPSTHKELLFLLTQILSSMQAKFVEGISEFELIALLKKPPFTILNEDALSDSLLMFQTHFILFHALYLLRNEWREAKVGELEISAIRIQLHAPIMHQANIQIADPLAEYYLDWQNLAQTDQAGAEDLLSTFWLKIAGYEMHCNISEDQLATAKANLELPTDADLSIEQLKQQYRKLQHKHHPDKGGSIDKSQIILEAYTMLQKSLLRNAYQK